MATLKFKIPILHENYSKTLISMGLSQKYSTKEELNFQYVKVLSYGFFKGLGQFFKKSYLQHI